MYYIIVNYDDAYFDVYKENDVILKDSRVDSIVTSLTTTYFGRNSVTIEIIDSDISSVRTFVPNIEKSNVNNTFEEFIAA